MVHLQWQDYTTINFYGDGNSKDKDGGKRDGNRAYKGNGNDVNADGNNDAKRQWRHQRGNNNDNINDNNRGWASLISQRQLWQETLLSLGCCHHANGHATMKPL
jgi:hypothetical protein